MYDSVSGFDFIKNGGYKNAIAIIVDGIAMDLSATFPVTASVEIIAKDHPEAMNIMRHTTSHIMAHAIKELYPNVKIAIGPTIENGFYYDVLCDHQIKPDDFGTIEDKMREIICANYKITREILPTPVAIEMFMAQDEMFKVELIRELNVPEVTIYKHEDRFMDLCRGPHLPRTGVASKHFRLMKVAGAYWRGDSQREMLQRIYATSWFSRENLDQYIVNLEEAEKRDHRKIGKDMDLFHIQEEAAGSIFWHPNGYVIYRTLRNFLRKFIQRDGYVEVGTPQMIDRSLWEASGHWDKFRQNMFVAESVDDKVLAIKPMNCPGHIQIFNQSVKSYRDLPLRMAEFGICHRNEPSGALYGTMRVRAFTQDDGHIFCTPDQINTETKRFCNLLTSVYNKLGFEEFTVKFSDRPPVRAGTDAVWDKSESLLKQATTEAGLEFTVNSGEGAFYGPKLEFVLRDKLGRDWQCGTLQVDFVLPERLDAWYMGDDGEKHHPILLHRAVLGSMERFIGILLENYAGKLPLWLSPVQVVVADITNDFDRYAGVFHDKLLDNDIRAKLDTRAEKISYKIRNHVMSKVPLIAIIGAEEVRDNTITLRRLDGTQEIFGINDAVIAIKEMCRAPMP
ncbi:MAG: threonine--tRNA ligase [Holosporaceae bacterium]|jgi:threonyl-tRNA synthetase|nr:threonine--tRNA ligase [Holosporaceae bacterium]